MYGEEIDDYDEDDFVFNEYAIDDSLDSLSRLEKYFDSDFSLQRLVLVRELPDTAREAGYEETNARLLPLLSNFVADTEPAIRQIFAEVLPALAKFCVEAGDEAGYHELIRTYIPYAFELIIDKNSEVGAAATEALTKISALLKQEHIEPQILSVIVNLAHDDRVEDYRIVAAQLFNELAPVFGEKLCCEIVVKEILQLSDDVSFSVRKTVAQNLGKICQTIGTENTVHMVLPIFLTLSKDEIWGVRKACAESLVAMSEHVTPEVRTNQLYDVFERFAEDVSRWVRISAFQNLGPFIATFKSEEVSENLLQFFTEMAFQKEGSSDSDMAEHCAYNFPAVVLAVKKEKWPVLEPAYMALVKDVQWKVRRSLACSLHEIANILGTELTEAHLTSAFELFLRDLDEVKVGVVENIAKFMAVLGPAERSKYLPTVCNIPRETDNWRIRREIAKQLADIASLVSPADVRDTIAKLTIHLIEDSVADVRSTAIASTGGVLKRLCQGEEGDKEQFLNYLLGLATEESYTKRQMFTYACQSIANEVTATLFESLFMPKLKALTCDRVANIRIAVGKLISETLVHHPYFKDHDLVLAIKEQLSADKDRDVSYFSGRTTGPKVRQSTLGNFQLNDTPTSNSSNNNDDSATNGGMDTEDSSINSNDDTKSGSSDDGQSPAPSAQQQQDD